MSSSRPILFITCLLVGQVLLLAQAVHAQQPPLALFAPLDLRESIPVAITGLSGEQPASRAGDAELALWALGDWSRALDGRFHFHEAGEEEQALLRIEFVPANGSQYGEMQPLNVNGKRGAVVHIRADTSALGPDIAALAAEDPLFRDTIVYLTCVHELGHALGLEHTANYADIMYFFGFGGDIVEYFMRYRRQLEERDDIALTSVLSAADTRRLLALYPDEAAP